MIMLFIFEEGISVEFILQLQKRNIIVISNGGFDLIKQSNSLMFCFQAKSFIFI